MSLFDFLKFARKKGAYEKTVLLSATGRSGTTWLAGLINTGKQFRIMFEPFHNQYVPAWSGFQFRQYLRGDESDPELLKAAELILSGSVSNTWVDKRIIPVVKKKLLIKDIRTNLMLGWLKRHYPKMPVILLIRHPGAVAQSKIKLKWDIGLENLTGQPRLMEDYLKPFSDMIHHPPESVFQSHILYWCAENYVPLLQLNSRDFHVIFYENLILNPEKEMRKLFRYIRERWDPRVLEGLDKPSFMAKDHSAILHKGADLLSGWRSDVSKEDLEGMRDVLRRFGMDRLYRDGDIPDQGALKEIRRIY